MTWWMDGDEDPQGVFLGDNMPPLGERRSKYIGYELQQDIAESEAFYAELKARLDERAPA